MTSKPSFYGMGWTVGKSCRIGLPAIQESMTVSPPERHLRTG